MYEMQGTLPGLAARASQLPGLPVPRAARQSQEPARGSGFPTPPTSRSCPRAVPVSNGESISTASAWGRASPLMPHFPVISLSTPISTEYGRLCAFSAGFPPLYTQPVHRSPGVTQRTPYRRPGLAAAPEKFAGVTLDLPALAYVLPGMVSKYSSACRQIPRRPASRGSRSWAARARARATMRMISRRRRDCRGRVRPGKGGTHGHLDPHQRRSPGAAA